MKMENPKKKNVRSTCHTLRECLTDSEYLAAVRKMEQAQKNYLKMGLKDDIEPLDWDDIAG